LRSPCCMCTVGGRKWRLQKCDVRLREVMFEELAAVCRIVVDHSDPPIWLEAHLARLRY
jgi:hypothetical protein